MVMCMLFRGWELMEGLNHYSSFGDAYSYGIIFLMFSECYGLFGWFDWNSSDFYSVTIY